jgi:hypothetical protein
MRIRLNYLLPLLATGAAGVAIAAAPVAAAATAPGPAPVEQSCTQNAAGSDCQSPGNVQIDDSPPVTNFYPYGGEDFLLGGYGFHGGGGHR